MSGDLLLSLAALSMLASSPTSVITRLGPGTSARDLLAPTMGSTMKVDARVTWADDSGDERSWESELSLM